LLGDAFATLPASPHVQIITIPGIGEATAAALVAKIGNIDRFATPEDLIGYFGIFPEENSSGVDKFGNPLPPGTMSMSHKGNDLVRHYLWNAARCAAVHNPVVKELYCRLRKKGTRGDVAYGHCMRKLLHLVFAVWKTNRPFDADHRAAQPVAATEPSAIPTGNVPATAEPPAPVGADRTPNLGARQTDPATANEAAVGHKQDLPAKKVVTTATHPTVTPSAPVVNDAPAPRPKARPKVDYAFLRQQVTMTQILSHLGLLDTLRGRGPQRRGPCPIHGQPGDTQPTFSAHLGRNIFQCFHADCRAQGNVLDLWAAVHKLPLYEAALSLAETFHVPRNRDEEPVKETR
jgi:hypothetical protein